MKGTPLRKGRVRIGLALAGDPERAVEIEGPMSHLTELTETAARLAWALREPRDPSREPPHVRAVHNHAVQEVV